MPVVFVSYSRDDVEWRRRFVEMLTPLVRERWLDVWSDERTVAGEQWRPDLAAAIERSYAGLLLVSPAFLASDFIMQNELPALRERGVPLVCALVRPCLWDVVPALEQLQWGHDPRRDGPVQGATDPDGQIVRICKRLLEVLPQGDGEPPTGRFGDVGWAGDSVAAIGAGERRGELHGVPSLPIGFVARDELEGLRDALLRGFDGAIGVTGKRLGLHGQGGIGKTVLAAALARDDSVRRHFPDGVFWVTVGERPDLVALQIELLGRVGAARSDLRSAREGLSLLRDALTERQCLLIVDDVWSVAAVQAFAAIGPHGRVLLTTRDENVLSAMHVEVHPVDLLPDATARQLLATLSGAAVSSLPPETDRVIAATGRVALALALVGAAVGRGGRAWEDAADELERGAETFLDHPYANTFKAMQVAVGALDDSLARAYESLAIYPEDEQIPLAAVAHYWSGVWDAPLEQTRDQLAVLGNRGLLSVADDTIAFHDLQHNFLLLRTSDLSLLNADLLATYRALLRSASGPWRELPRDVPYIWRHLLYHLRGAGEGTALRETVTDVAYLVLRAFDDGPHAAESDLRYATALFDDDAGLSWLSRLFSQWGHLLAGHRTVGEIATTLFSRLRDAPATINAEALSSLLPEHFLTARWGLPRTPAALARVIEGHHGGVVAVGFSPDGTLLASASDDRSVRLWDTATGQAIATLEGHTGGVRGVAFSPDGRLLASGSGDGSVRLWDVATRQQIARLEGHTDWVSGVAFSPDGRLLASTGDDQSVRLWNTRSRQQVAILEGHAGGVRGVAFSPDGRLLASTGDDGSVRIWDTATGQHVAMLEGHAGGVRAVAFSPDGRLLASTGSDGSVRLWVMATRQQIATLEDHTGGVRGVAFSPDGRLLASASDDRSVRLWDTATGEQIATLEGHTGWVRGVAFSPDGRLLASAGYDGSVRLWDTARGQRGAMLEGHTGWVRGVAFSPDGRLLASTGDDRSVRLWDAATGQQIVTLEGHVRSVRGVAFSPDGRLLASTGDDTSVRLWDAATGQQIVTLEGHVRSVRAVAFSPDGRLLASGSGDGSVRLWDVATRQQIGSLEGHTDWVRGVAFSPGGLLASASNDRSVRLWDTATGQQIATLEGHTDWVSGVAFSPGGRLLASASDDRSVRLWDVATRQQIGRLEGHTDWVSGVAFSPDGRLLASASEDRSVRLWDPTTALELNQLRLGTPAQAVVWGVLALSVAAGTRPIVLDLVEHAPPDR